MAFDFKFPDVGEGVTEGHIVKWLVKEGDTVEIDQPIAEIETAKAVVEVPSPKAGTILRLYHKAGETISVGDILVTLGEKGEKASAPAPQKQATETKSEQKEPLPPPPKPEKQEAVKEKPTPTPKTVEEVAPPPKVTEEKTTAKALPATRKLAQTLGVDISKIQGTGPGGRITEQDVKAAKVAAPPGHEQAKHPATATTTPRTGPKIKFEKYGRVIRVPMNNVRKIIAKRMVESAFTIPHVTHVEEIDVTELDKIRKAKKQEATNKGFNLTFMPFIMKACVTALRDHPYVNASIDEEKQEIILKKHYHLGFAVDTGQGLMVPVIKHVDNLSILQIAKEITKFAEECRSKEIQPKDLQGHTFTVTNIGSIGGVMATPIINYPDAAILGMYRMKELPRVIDGKVVVRKVMNLSLTFDHRIIDGAQAAKFMIEVKKLLEDPQQLLLDVF